MKIGRLHVLTDTVLQDRYGHAALAEMAIHGGAEVIQYRRKEGPTRELIEEARVVREVCRRMHAIFLVNDRVDIAVAVDADGVHLGREDFPIPLARRLLGPYRILGGSAGTLEEAIACWREGADYLGCGPVYGTASKADAGPAAGTALIEQIARAVPIPVLGIGGITAANVRHVLRAGAHGIAVISAVCCADDPAAATAELRRALDAATAQAAG